MCRRRPARSVPLASRRTRQLHPGRARLQGSPCHSRDAKVAAARRTTPLRAPHCRAAVLPRARRAAIKVSATNAMCARVGRQHQTRPALRPQRASRRVHSAMKAEEMCGGERNPDGISAASGKAGLQPPRQTPRSRRAKGGVVHKSALPAPAPVARRPAAASVAVSASCATGRRRERLLRKSRAAANGPDSKVREIRAPRANAGQPSGLLQPRRPNFRWRGSVVHLHLPA